MIQLNMKKFRYWQYQYEIVAKHELTPQQGVVYGYLYNHCVNLNNEGYCGYSDERMANDINIPYSSFKKDLKVLREKGLIIVKNPNKRTKKTGESRMIYINSDTYLIDKQMDLRDIENQNLHKKLERADKRIAELEMLLTQSTHPEPVRTSYFGLLAVKSGFIPETVYLANTGTINAYFEYLVEHTDPFWTKRAIKYFAKIAKGTKINCYISYLEKCVQDSILSYQLENKHQELALKYGNNGLEPRE